MLGNSLPPAMKRPVELTLSMGVMPDPSKAKRPPPMSPSPNPEARRV
jgi:hypothetical protein